MRTPPS